MMCYVQILAAVVYLVKSSDPQNSLSICLMVGNFFLHLFLLAVHTKIHDKSNPFSVAFVIKHLYRFVSC